MEFNHSAPMYFSDRLASEGALQSSGYYHHVTRFLVPWRSQLAENVMEAEI
jgi:hypothetical protein